MFLGKVLSSSTLVGVLVALSGQARAQITHLEASLDGAQECTVVTAGTGAGNFTLNVGTHAINHAISWQNLSSATNLGHIHGPAALCVQGAAVFTLYSAVTSSPISGSFPTTAAQEANLLAGSMYANLHTVNFSGGEIRGQILLSPAVGTPFCFGDGSGAQPCPCGNTGAAGNGCDNSAGTGGARLDASGHTSPDNVVLVTQGELPTVLSIFLQGDMSIAPSNFGDGLRCAGGSLKRLGAKNAFNGWVAYPEGAELSITAKSASLGDTIPPGGTRHYQTYYRDSVLGFCPAPPGNSWNVSRAVSITW